VTHHRLPLLIFILELFSTTFARAQDPTIRFIENKNQWPASVDFGARVAGGTMLLQPEGFRYYFLDQEKLEQIHERGHSGLMKNANEHTDELIDGTAIQVKFNGANPLARAIPQRQLKTYYNYFIGNNEKSWASGAAAYENVQYHNLYDGIDLSVYSAGSNLKYDYIVAPCADPSLISMEYEGADDLSLADGDVSVHSKYVSMVEKKPIAYQIINGTKVWVTCEYVLSSNRLSFCFPFGYDSNVELVIDPLLIFSTYSGSTADNWGSTATPGEHGTLYSSGVTNHFVGGTFSGTFPATAGAFQTTYGGVYDVAILKYDSLGQHLLYASYLGGIDSESPHSLVINKDAELMVLGTTSSNNFPTTAGAFNRTFQGGTFENNVIPYSFGSDIFVARISRDGSQLLSSTFLGGTANDGLNPNTSPLTANYGDQLRGDIITDDQNNVYISSVTSSPNFPVGNSYSTTYRGGATDAIILKLNPSLSQILWGAFVGGTSDDASHTIKLSQTGSVYAAGGTASSNFPTTANVYQPVFNGGVDGWISNIAGDGSSLLSATFTGTPQFDQIYFLELNTAGDVYAYGQTTGSFPVSAGVYHNNNGRQFVQKFSSNLTTLGFSTVFGSGRSVPDISPTSFLVNECNNLYMSGWGGLVNTLTGHWPGSSTFGLPVTADAFQSASSGSDFYFMVLTADASQLLYSSYLGGNQSRTHVDGGTSRFDKSGVVYHAVCSGCQAANPFGPSSDFPVTPNAWSSRNNSLNCNNAAFKFDLSSLKARIQTNNVALTSPGFNQVCIPDKIVFQNKSIGGEIFEWKLGDGTNITKTDRLDIVHQYQNEGTYVVKLKAIDAGTCKGKDSTSVMVFIHLPKGSGGPDKFICQGAATQLQGSDGSSYEWKSDGGTFTSTQSGPTVTPDITTRYFVTIHDVNSCVKKDTVEVKVQPGLKPKFNINLAQDCTTRAILQVENLTEGADNFYFDYGDGVTSNATKDVHSYGTDGTYNVTFNANKGTCQYKEGKTVDVYTWFAPNVITPGSSPGANDFFRIKYGTRFLSDSGLSASLVVYNRYGTQVYQSKDYKENWSGEGLSEGTYYYEVTIDNQFTCKSWVQIIR
jgi:hypothetical protein